MRESDRLRARRRPAQVIAFVLHQHRRKPLDDYGRAWLEGYAMALRDAGVITLLEYVQTVEVARGLRLSPSLPHWWEPKPNADGTGPEGP